MLIPLRAAQAEAARKAAEEAARVEAAKALAEQQAARQAAQADATAQAAPTQVTVAPSGSSQDWMSTAGIASSDFGYVDFIVTHEGGWSGAQRYNTGGSGAYGLCQALPGSKMSSAGDDWATNPVTQLRWCDSYASGRYGGWANAYSFWLAHNWW